MPDIERDLVNEAETFWFRECQKQKAEVERLHERALVANRMLSDAHAEIERLLALENGDWRARYSDASHEIERLREALVLVYMDSPASAAAVARVCDEYVDRSGRLLGEIRSRVRNG